MQPSIAGHGVFLKFPLSRRGYGAATSLLDLAGHLPGRFFGRSHVKIPAARAFILPLTA
jgi:hypothetical protein